MIGIFSLNGFPVPAGKLHYYGRIQIVIQYAL